MNDTNNMFKPVVIYERGSGHLTAYYGSAYATGLDGYNPQAVLRVCEKKQKKHKGKEFYFLEEFGRWGEKYQAECLEAIKREREGGGK